MPRDYRARENRIRSKAKRDMAIARNELRGPSEQRQAPAGATSFPVKVRSEQDDVLIRDFLSRKQGDK
jgi:hypothetical protein